MKKNPKYTLHRPPDFAPGGVVSSKEEKVVLESYRKYYTVRIGYYSRELKQPIYKPVMPFIKWLECFELKRIAKLPNTGIGYYALKNSGTSIQREGFVLLD